VNRRDIGPRVNGGRSRSRGRRREKEEGEDKCNNHGYSDYVGRNIHCWKRRERREG